MLNLLDLAAIGTPQDAENTTPAAPPEPAAPAPLPAPAPAAQPKPQTLPLPLNLVEEAKAPGELPDPARFITAGKAIFTVRSKASGERLTYKVTAAKDKDGLYFVSVLSGPENDSDYTYVGSIIDNTFRLTKKSRVTKESKSYRVFYWLWNHLIAKLPTSQWVEVFHEGRCCRCGRRLTVPESILTGIGPECASKGF